MKKSRIVALFFAVIMLLSVLPMTALADDAKAEELADAVKALNELSEQGQIVEQQLENADGIQDEQLQKAAEVIEDAIKNTEDEVKAAEETVNQANEELKAAAEDFNQSFMNYTGEIAKNIGVTAISGAALEAANITSDIIDINVKLYEKRIESVMAQLSEAKEALAQADAAVNDAQAQVDAAELETSALSLSEKALEIANEALRLAGFIKNNCSAIISASGSSAYTEDMNELREKVKNGTATTEDIAALTKIVLENLAANTGIYFYTDVEPVEGQENIFSATENGETVYIKSAVENGVLNFYPATKNEEKIIAAENGMESAESYYNNDKSNAKAELEDGTRLDIIVKRSGYGIKISPYKYTYQVKSGKNSYDLKWDENGAYYTASKKDYRVTVIIVPETDFNVSDKALYANSDTIINVWEYAKNIENHYNEAVADQKEKQAAYNTAKAEYDALCKSLAKLISNRDKAAKSQANLQQKYDELNDKLYGSGVDTLVRSFIKGDYKDAADAGVKLLLDIISGRVSMGDISDAYTEFSSFSKAMMAFSNIASGKLTSEDVKTIADVLGALDVPVLTRQALADRICELLSAIHTSAYNSIGTSIQNAATEMKAKTQNFFGALGNSIKSIFAK